MSPISQRDPVILVHGLWMTGLEFGVLRQRLQTLRHRRGAAQPQPQRLDLARLGGHGGGDGNDGVIPMAPVEHPERRGLARHRLGKFDRFDELVGRQRGGHRRHKKVAGVDPALLDTMVNEVSLDESIAASARLMAGHVRGRIVVRID